MTSRRAKLRTFGGAVAIIVVAIAIFLSFGGGRRDSGHTRGNTEHDHDTDDLRKSHVVDEAVHAGHEHDEGGESYLDMTLEEIVAAQCEHNTATYQCDPCRYEVGVVKLPASMLKDSHAAQEGLFSTEVVARRQVGTSLEVSGEIGLNENSTVRITSSIPGIIENVKVDIGERARKGDVLFRIKSAELGKAIVDFQRSRALTELSRKILDREKSLFERKIGSEQDMIEAQMAYEQNKTELDAADHVLHILGLTEDDLEAMTEQAHGVRAGSLPVRAPIGGTVIEKHAVAGEQIDVGTEVMLVTDLANVWVWADVYERDLSRLLEAEKGGPIPVQLHTAAFPDRLFEGSINYIGATMQETTRTVKVRATVRNPHHLLRPGMFCRMQIRLGGAEEVLAVPKTAIMSDEGRDFVFRQWKEDYYVMRAVQKGREFYDTVEVVDGLSSGETIVTEGAFLLKSDVLREKMGAGCAD